MTVLLKKWCYTILFFQFFTWLSAQNIPISGLDTLEIYEDLKEALKNPNKVYGVSLKKQKLTEFPIEVFSFKNLVYLDISKNKIQQIPSHIDTLKKLVVLNMSNNHIQGLPESLFNLKNLQYLILGKNKIPYVSSSISKLKELLYLDVWSNEFYSLPPEIADLKKLQKLDLRLINLSLSKQKQIQQWLPHTVIYFSNGCDCD